MLLLRSYLLISVLLLVVKAVQLLIWSEPDPVVTAAIRVKYAGRRVPLAVRDRLGQWLDDEARQGRLLLQHRDISQAVTAQRRLECLDHRDAGDLLAGRLQVAEAMADHGGDGPKLRAPAGAYRHAATARTASSALLTIGMMTLSALTSGTRPMMPGSFQGTRTRGAAVKAAKLRSGVVVESVLAIGVLRA